LSNKVIVVTYNV